MASRVNVGRIQYNMPDVYGMSKDAYEGSLKGTVGRNIGRVGKALAARMAAERIAEDQANKSNFAKANELANSKAFTGQEFDSGVSPEEKESLKGYDPFKDNTSDMTGVEEISPLFLDYELNKDLMTDSNTEELFL